MCATHDIYGASAFTLANFLLPCIRWIPKLKDGIRFGIEYPDIVEIEEERWTVEATSLEVGGWVSWWRSGWQEKWDTMNCAK